MSRMGRHALLAIGAACAIGIASFHGAMAISTLSDTLQNLPQIQRLPSANPPNSAVHRDFGGRPEHAEPQFQDVGPGPAEDLVIVPAAAAPWTVAIAYGPQLNRDFLCAGALVATEWVLTAAHCMYNVARRWPTDDSVYVFESAGSLSSPGPRYPVQEVVLHPDYDPRTLQNDLALVRIATGGKAANLPISLDGIPIARQIGAIGSILGWGVSTLQAGRRHRERLHVIQLAVVDRGVCFSAAQFPQLSKSRVFCGRSLLAHHDVCFRYGGSPIVFYDRKAHLYLGGIVSWPATCGERGLRLNVYLDVQSYLPWINSVIKKAAG
jgi:secreted trypsin-like serine protease